MDVAQLRRALKTFDQSLFVKIFEHDHEPKDSSEGCGFLGNVDYAEVEGDEVVGYYYGELIGLKTGYDGVKFTVAELYEALDVPYKRGLRIKLCAHDHFVDAPDEGIGWLRTAYEVTDDCGDTFIALVN